MATEYYQWIRGFRRTRLDSRTPRLPLSRTRRPRSELSFWFPARRLNFIASMGRIQAVNRRTNTPPLYQTLCHPRKPGFPFELLEGLEDGGQNGPHYRGHGLARTAGGQGLRTGRLDRKGNRLLSSRRHLGAQSRSSKRRRGREGAGCCQVSASPLYGVPSKARADGRPRPHAVIHCE